MDDDTKSRIDDIKVTIHQKIEDVKSIIDNMRIMISWVIGLGGAFMIAFTFVAGWANISERNNLASFQKDIRDDIRERLTKSGDVQLELEVVGRSVSLSNQEIVAEIVRNPFQRLVTQMSVPPLVPMLSSQPWRTTFFIGVRNTSSHLGNISLVKIYTKEPFRDDIGRLSADEADYKYEMVTNSSGGIPYPGGSKLTTPVWLYSSNLPTPGKYDVLIKLYYVNGRSIQAIFKIIVPRLVSEFLPDNPQR